MSDFVIVEKVSKAFGKPNNLKPVLSEIDIRVGKGQVLAICGNSGVGKSTLIRLIAGLEKPDSGKIEIDGESPTSLYPRIGLVSQDYSRSLLPWLSAISNVELALLSTIHSKIHRREIASHWLEETGLSEASKRKPWQLSGGMQQRVAFARAFALNPKLICLDEPFASLDSFNRESLQDLVLSLVKRLNLTAVLVTHDVDEAVYMADKILVLREGNSGYRLLESTLSGPRGQETRSTEEFLRLRAQLVETLSATP